MKMILANLIFFILKNKIKLLIVILVSFITLLIMYSSKKQEKNLEFFYPIINESIENDKITSETSTKLFMYFLRKGDLEKAKTWNQICLFFKNSYCIQYTVYWSLEDKDSEIRKNYFLNHISPRVNNDLNEQERCYSIYYNTQNDFIKNKDNFINNYKTCRKYYLTHIPALRNYELNFLEIFKK